MRRQHEMPFGAELRNDNDNDGSVRFRLWAPASDRVELCLSDRALPMQKAGEGWFELTTREAEAGSHYKFKIDGRMEVPDPASRSQPDDVHGPSRVVDAAGFDWQDSGWRGRPWEEAVIYELHVGTFTPEGTFAAVERRLDYLVDIGMTAIELMPVSDFPGTRNWGYDGVLPFAPDSSYGTPDDLKRLVQAVHQKGLMIFLDVVYNHFGPEGNYLRTYAPQFFTDRHPTPWGDGINFDGPCSRTVRDFFIHNALYWLEEYHFDGLRLDAVHAIKDDSDPDILTELAEAVRQKFRNSLFVHLVLENDDNASRYLKRDPRGQSQLYDAQWNDDIHHGLHLLITGETDGYYSDYARQPARHLARCLAEGFSYQGEPSPYRGNQPRGEPSRNLPPTSFVSFLQNHDQVGNRALGERILELARPEALRAALSVLLLAPSPPLLFMGEEFGARTPFLFFCDFGAELATAVTEGRRKEFARFAKFSSAESREQIPDPGAKETFLRSKLDWNSLNAKKQASWLEFYRDLLHLRQSAIVPLLRRLEAGNAQFTVLGEHALAVNWKMKDGKTLSLLANLGDEIAEIETVLAEKMIYSTGEVSQTLADKKLPPWLVAWFLHS